MEEDTDECLNVDGGFLGRRGGLAVFPVAERDADRLFKENDVGLVVPGIRVPLCSVHIRGVDNCARPEFHEEAEGGGAARSTVDPGQDWVLAGLGSTFEKVEEEVPAVTSVDVPRVRADVGIAPACGFLDLDFVLLSRSGQYKHLENMRRPTGNAAWVISTNSVPTEASSSCESAMSEAPGRTSCWASRSGLKGSCEAETARAKVDATSQRMLGTVAVCGNSQAGEGQLEIDMIYL